MIAQLDRRYVRLSKWRALRRVIAWAFFEGRPLTTRGRWFNPVVFALLRLLRTLPLADALDRPVFIVGIGRSGTTFLGVSLSMHRDVGFLNESKAIWHVAIPDEDVVGNWADWPGRYHLGADDATPAVRRAFVRQYGGWLRFACAKRLVDKYPELVFRLPLLHALFPDARVIWLQRNDEDTCRSVARWSKEHAVQSGGVRDDWWGRDDRKWRLLVDQVAAFDADLAPHLDWLRNDAGPVDRAAVEWILAMRAGQRAQEQHLGAMLPLRYEDLLADPQAALVNLAAFCELPPDEKVAAYVQEAVRDAGAGTREPLRLDARLHAPFRAVSAMLGYDACVC